ncbi:MAG: NHL repeat-containing protein [Candidatus Eisenbacteria bacterium]
MNQSIHETGIATEATMGRLPQRSGGWIVTGWISGVLAASLWASPSQAEGAVQATPLWMVDRTSAAVDFNRPLGLAYDAQGDLLWVADTGNHRIRALDGSGMQIRSYQVFADSPRGPIPGEPKNLAVTRDGLLYLIDALSDRVEVMDLLGQPVRQIDPAQFKGWAAPDPNSSSAIPGDFRPVSLALDPEDHLIVAVGSHDAVIVCVASDDTILWTVDGRDAGAKPFGAITSLYMDPAGRLYITDATAEPPVRVYDSEHELLLALGTHDVGNENFSLPTAVVAASGRMWVADAIRQTIKVFALDGTYVGMVGAAGRELGDLLYPAAMATDGKDRLFVLERLGARLSAFQMSAPEISAEATTPTGRDSVGVGVDGLGGRTDILAPGASR